MKSRVNSEEAIAGYGQPVRRHKQAKIAYQITSSSPVAKKLSRAQDVPDRHRHELENVGQRGAVARATNH